MITHDNKLLLKFIIPAIIIRLIFFAFGIWQDNNLTVNYTDVDYLVFTDAAYYLYNGLSPFLRDTYRYTPLLAVMLLPTAIHRSDYTINTKSENLYFHLGKLLFMFTDIITGLLIYKILNVFSSVNKKKKNNEDNWKNLWLTCIWWFNPMVITISTRGNCETVLTCLVLLTFYHLQVSNVKQAAFWFGLSIHFKIYPVIYCIPITIYLCGNRQFNNWIKFATISIITLLMTNFVAYYFYGYDYLYEAWIYHLVRIDHRHNFSVWNTYLYYASAQSDNKNIVERLAFLPQLSLVVLTGILLQYSSNNFKRLLNVSFIQTLIFVAFNKVCTSQYFIWYLTFVPFYCYRNGGQWTRWKFFSLLSSWIIAQAIWLHYAYRLEFLGENVFVPQLFVASLLFFFVHVQIIAVVIRNQ